MSAVLQPTGPPSHALLRSEDASVRSGAGLDPRSAASRRDVSKSFGRALRQVRKRVGLTQEKLAERAGLDRTYPSLLERGLRSPTLTVLFALAEALGCAPQSLLDATLSALGDAHGGSAAHRTGCAGAGPADGSAAHGRSSEGAPTGTATARGVCRRQGPK